MFKYIQKQKFETFTKEQMLQHVITNYTINY
jgi:hypothetical protein